MRNNEGKGLTSCLDWILANMQLLSEISGPFDTLNSIRYPLFKALIERIFDLEFDKAKIQIVFVR